MISFESYSKTDCLNMLINLFTDYLHLVILKKHIENIRKILFIHIRQLSTLCVTYLRQLIQMMMAT